MRGVEQSSVNADATKLYQCYDLMFPQPVISGSHLKSLVPANTNVGYKPQELGNQLQQPYWEST
jgi:hypothetical protein